MATITVTGLGPGRAGLITRESWELMAKAERLVLRTRIHPTVAAIEAAGMTFSTYDGFYEEAADFESLYGAIARDLLQRAKSEGDIVYAVPGSPLVAERTVVLLREFARTSEVTVNILPGMSFVEVMYTRLGIDPIDGLTILDAEDVATLKERPAQSLVITQVYSQPIASDTKLMLMELFPDEYEVTYIHNLALPDESIRQIPLYELDRQKDVDHLTSLFIRAKSES
ncbi:tetrapyrrole methylase family protein / MazG family protein [Selenomonas ruminantium]|uniref:Tetrapyrrole methylase family protein / MazG family protein n=1 Tax=Selenomonas ruminantium TaxID=971 RepID=A0A1I3F7I0_SELRU|nr:SAM-dependent methyltransferase [Selenomonas ruminantium]MBQ1890696.1 tetrapyrrole methylase [Selenomonas sp.]SFI07165.1 tetrapyrrole methylase family protein / MazG family protein [Selenomonas ruminantium]